MNEKNISFHFNKWWPKPDYKVFMWPKPDYKVFMWLKPNYKTNKRKKVTKDENILWLFDFG